MASIQDNVDNSTADIVAVIGQGESQSLAGRSRTNQPRRFFELPELLRKKIYSYIFLRARMEINSQTLVWKNVAEPSRPEGFPNAILQTCKTIREEAKPILQQNISLLINKPYYNRYAPVFLKMARSWRDSIVEFEYTYPPTLRLHPPMFGALKRIVLDTKVYAFSKSSEPSRDKVQQFVDDCVDKHDKYLSWSYYVWGLEEDDGIKVIVPIWLLQERVKQSRGWVCRVEIRD